MPDNLSIKGPEDSKRINIHEPWERIQWCKKFNVTEQQLIYAVSQVGTSASDVRDYLKNH